MFENGDIGIEKGKNPSWLKNSRKVHFSYNNSGFVSKNSRMHL